MTMTWDETDHPRLKSGEFSEKMNSEFTGSLPEVAELPRESYRPVYTMPAAYLPYAEEKIRGANQRLKRHGIEERFEIEVGHRVVTREGQTKAVVDITLNRPSISLAGWTFEGAHDFTPDGRVVHHYSDPNVAETVTDNRCDHCGHNRRRERVMTITNEQGETKQIGSNCLQAFLGVRPQGLWALTDDVDLGDMEELARESPNLHGSSAVIPAESLIVAALAATGDGREYVSQANATMEQSSTSSVVARDWDELMERGDTAARRTLARKVLRWVAQAEGDSDYIGNLKAVLGGKDRYVGEKHIAIAASAVAAYRNEEARAEREAARAARIANRVSGYLAAEGDKVADVPATVLGTREFDTHYGTTTLVRMRADTGHTVTWFASGVKDFEEGAKVMVSGRVKKHDQYDGDDQTVLTRAKLTPVE